MLAWLRERVGRLAVDIAEAFDPDACPDCDDGYYTVFDPWLSDYRMEVCRTCHGTGKRERR